MLPYIDLAEAKHKIINFDQQVCFNFAESVRTENGACAGISIDWINQHSLGKMSTFVKKINSERRFYDIDEAQFICNNYDSTIWVDTYLCRYKKKLKVVNHHLFPSPIKGISCISEVLFDTKGYLLVSYRIKANKESYCHAIAVHNNVKGCEFFDSNYGSAFFDDRVQFMNWFDLYIYSLSARSNNNNYIIEFYDVNIAEIHKT